MTELKPKPMQVWIAVTDKIGHVNQCIALTDALGRAPDRIERITGFNLRHGPLVKILRRVSGLAQTLRLVTGTPLPERLVYLLCHAGADRFHRGNFLG